VVLSKYTFLAPVVVPLAKVRFKVAFPFPANGIYKIIYFPSYNSLSVVVPVQVPDAAVQVPTINSGPENYCLAAVSVVCPVPPWAMPNVPETGMAI